MPIDSNFKARLNKLQSEAEDIYYQMSGKKEKIDVQLAPETELAAAIAHPKTLYINPLILTKPNELPKNIKDLKAWISTKFDLSEDRLDRITTAFEELTNQWKGDIEFNRIRKFAITHEIAHIFHNHQTGNWNRWCGLITNCFVAIYFFNTFHLVTAIALCAMIFYITRKVFYCLRCYLEQKHEIEADLTALQITKDYKAAKHFFKRNAEFGQKQWDSCSLLQKLVHIIHTPEVVFHLTHPSPQERINYLKAAQKV